MTVPEYIMHSALSTEQSQSINTPGIADYKHPIQFSADFQPNPTDICLGRGKRNWCHPGNVAFRALIRASVPAYREAPSKIVKSIIVNEIVNSLRIRGVLFLEKTKHGDWFEIGNQKARDKVSHSLRDYVHAQRVQAKKLKTKNDDIRAREYFFEVTTTSSC